MQYQAAIHRKDPHEPFMSDPQALYITTNGSLRDTPEEAIGSLMEEIINMMASIVSDITEKTNVCEVHESTPLCADHTKEVIGHHCQVCVSNAMAEVLTTIAEYPVGEIKDAGRKVAGKMRTAAGDILRGIEEIIS